MSRLIVVDATPYGMEPSGAKRRAVEILRRLPALLPGDVFEVHWARDGGPRPAALELENVVHATVGVSCRGGASRWRARARDLRRRRREAAFSHLLVDHGPVVAPGRVRTVLTVHDLRFLHGYGGILRGLYGRHLYGRVLRRACAVVAVSEAVRDEVREAYGADLSPVVARNAPWLPARPPDDPAVAAALARLGVSRPYVLVVGRDEPRKALRAAVAAWGSALRASGVGLVVAGAPGFAPDGVTSPGAVADDDLAALYAGARRTIVPSRYEGFALPIVESLAAGTPVLASDLPAHRELLAATGSGLVLVPAPRAADGPWPEGAAAMRDGPAPVVAPPSWTWDEAARVVAAAIRGG